MWLKLIATFLFIAGVGFGQIASTTGDDITYPVTRAQVEDELRHRTFCFVIHKPSGTIDAATDDITVGWRVLTYPITVTKLECGTDTGTVTANAQTDDGTPADIATADLVCSTSWVTNTTFTAGEDTVADGQSITLDIASVATSPTELTFCVEYSID
jgi:hypothetical protein